MCYQNTVDILSKKYLEISERKLVTDPYLSTPDLSL